MDYEIPISIIENNKIDMLQHHVIVYLVEIHDFVKVFDLQDDGKLIKYQIKKGEGVIKPEINSEIICK